MWVRGVPVPESPRRIDQNYYSLSVFQSWRNRIAAWCVLLLCTVAAGQVAVTTNRYDTARTGQNTQEKTLSPQNVTPTQ